MESYKIAEKFFKIEEDYQDYWISVLYEYDPILVNKILKEWKTKKLSKKFLDSLKFSIDYHHSDIYSVFICKSVFISVPTKLIDMLFINLVSPQIKEEEKDLILENIELLIYYNAKLGESVKEIIWNFKCLIMMQELMEEKKEESDTYYSAKEYFLNESSRGSKISWLVKMLRKPQKLILLLHNIINGEYPKSLYWELKYYLNIKYYYDHREVDICEILLMNLFSKNYVYIVEDEEFDLDPEQGLMILREFIELGATIYTSHLEHIEPYLKYIKKAVDIYDKAIAGRKIVKFIKDKIDDEFEFKPLRAKLDLKKILEIEKEREGLVE